MLILFLIIALLGLSYVLSRSTDWLVAGIEQVSKGTAIQSYGITTLIVALATSLPELFVVVTSALGNSGDLPLGVILGSNIANITLIIGGAALISGVVRANDELFWRDVLYAFLIGSMPLLLLLDNELSRFDGAVLIVIYIIFSIISLSGKEKKTIKSVEKKYYEPTGLRHRILHLVGRKDIEQGMLRLTLGSAGLIVASNLIVRLANTLAIELSAPIILVGLFMISVGTSLPELAFEIKTVRKREYMMAFGNIVGSTVVNSSLVLGLGAFIRPFRLNGDTNVYYVSVIAFVVAFWLFWGLTRSEKALHRWEGAVLVGVYFIFLIAQIFVSCSFPVFGCS